MAMVWSHGGSGNLALFHRMLDEGVRPNGVTFLSLLSACSYSGLVNEAHELFDCMTTMFGFTPELGHYTCMVDVLGRSGNLDDALQVISDMNVKARWENLGCSPCFMQDILEQ